MVLGVPACDATAYVKKYLCRGKKKMSVKNVLNLLSLSYPY